MVVSGVYFAVSILDMMHHISNSFNVCAMQNEMFVYWLILPV